MEEKRRPCPIGGAYVIGFLSGLPSAWPGWAGSPSQRPATGCSLGQEEDPGSSSPCARRYSPLNGHTTWRKEVHDRLPQIFGQSHCGSRVTSVADWQPGPIGHDGDRGKREKNPGARFLMQRAVLEKCPSTRLPPCRPGDSKWNL